uniref:Uncharacterized protein n=1 Tax=Chromera velia CCMP2878 TaxID=1169474 RepID=A0A0G4F2P1_9ALVE|eukprot:Cvel_14836.t1-p1 / transcript=Cvel_14836.t1 / gene=Cvel_14836 / organism=Chromera_velia_CCMP2878 / gene_product=hypothetical protein / transcript_product=hypothetical protein / location=Cvel_scaffold1071:37005-38386(+) / protein_length=186 / sequence_SO=supercontig / SO=protein_coding / is_pseudo=false
MSQVQDEAEKEKEPLKEGFLRTHDGKKGKAKPPALTRWLVIVLSLTLFVLGGCILWRRYVSWREQVDGEASEDVEEEGGVQTTEGIMDQKTQAFLWVFLAPVATLIVGLFVSLCMWRRKTDPLGMTNYVQFYVVAAIVAVLGLALAGFFDSRCPFGKFLGAYHWRSASRSDWPLWIDARTTNTVEI